MQIDGAPINDKRDALRELSVQQCVTAIRDSGAFMRADKLANSLHVDANELRNQLAIWKERGEIFTLEDAAAGELFPAFAVDNRDGLRVFDAIPRILQVFKGRLSPWGIAGWFVGVSSFLDDQLPKDLLADEPDWVVEAARDWFDECAHG
jgi:hypothetical protein